MKRFLRLTVLSALMLTGNAAFAQDECTKITATGHPAYPVIAYKNGDNIVGAAPTLVETIAKQINVPLESKYTGTWEEAQAAAKTVEATSFWVSLMVAGSSVGAARARASSTSPLATQPKRLVAPPDAPPTKPGGASRCGTRTAGR